MALRKRTKNPAFATNIETIVSIVKNNFCPVSQVAKCFVPFQIFWVSPKIWLHLVPLQKLLCWHKKQFYWMQIIFLSGTKCLWLPQYVNKFLVWHKKFGPAQNILGPVKGQGISFLIQGTRTLACMGAQNCIDSHLDIFSFVLANSSYTNKHVPRVELNSKFMSTSR